MFIELHMLQNFAPSNLNRDDTNNPKDCMFGGVRRARISSQCIKRAIRKHSSFSAVTQVPLATRSKYICNEIVANLEGKGYSDKDVENIVKVFVAELLGGIDTEKQKDEGISPTKVLYFFSAEEVEQMAQLIQENLDEMGGIVSKLDVEKHIAKKLSDSKNRKLNKYTNKIKPKRGESSETSYPDIAMFGRMLANAPTMNIDAACQVAHAISTHRVNMEFDFFTAVDDLQGREETGAGMMGITGFNAATFYRYARIDFNQLVANLGGDVALARKTVEAFLRAAALAVPTGKQNSFAAQNPPSFLMTVPRADGMSWSLANAFEKPVYPSHNQSLLEASVEALAAYWFDLTTFYGEGPHPVVGRVGSGPDLPSLGFSPVNTFEDWVGQTLDALPKE